MQFSSGYTGCEPGISDLFLRTFAVSDGAEEGALIGAFVTDLMKTTQEDDLFVFSGFAEQARVGCIIFSRMTYDQDDKTVFILSPVAVAPEWQKQGVGQGLISYGLAELRKAGVDVVLTYGDPNYYNKVGFAQIDEAIARAPLNLSQPQGWQGQALGQTQMPKLIGPARCVDALNNPALW